MPNIATVLKSEISRIARKEVRAELESLKKAVSQHRSEIAALKRSNHSLEKALRRQQKSATSAVGASETEAESKSLRFSAKGLASNRQRLGLSAEACGLLVGTSGQTIYHWESGKSRPRASHLEAIAALRTMGKKRAAEIIAARTPA